MTVNNGLIVSFGEMLIDFVPTVSGVSLAEAPGFLNAPGGAPANVAIAFPNVGLNSQMWVLTNTGQCFPLWFNKLDRGALQIAHLKAMEVAKEAGALLSYDPNLRLPLWPSAEEARTQIMSIWDKAELIKVSDNELEFLTGSDKIDDESALSLWHDNLKLLLVTLGEKGCRYYTKEEAKLREVLKFANACGAITTTKKGAIPALPTEPEALTLVKGK
ncbi:hypothetical protein C3L33_20441, partial [Rhododendron williamsianum]